MQAADTCLKIINKRASLLGLDQINRNGHPDHPDHDLASLLGTMPAQLQQRYQVAAPDLDAIKAADVQAEVVTVEVLYDDAGGEA
ncbi:hypothetical protein ACIBQ1_40795 [Nonomuraea sp. NPDC050153]|uniref:hypothetical protein n=1 Tax=Nonomuraea sp. NPDC050153 TaxID=3364359 RepID=UPI0037A82E5E